ncbi:MAG: NAD(P)-dependent oxidoreductase [Gemmatimonadales bacterium]
MIAFLGTGLLGSNFVRAFRRRGESVHVWNRTPDKARALALVGATVFASAADAVIGAARVHLAVSDDAAVDEVLRQIDAALPAGSVIVDHTTTAPAPTAERVRHWIGRGFVFQHAPVFMGPQNALDATGSMLASGDRATFDLVAPALQQMTGKLVYLGADPARAASIKLLGNLFLLAMTAGLADVFTLAKALRVPAADAAQMFDWFNPGAVAPARAARMRDGIFSDPSWTLAMARKDARLMIESAGANGANLALIPAVADEMDRWIAAGHAEDDWMVIGKDAVT